MNKTCANINQTESQHGEKGTEHKFLPQATTISKYIV